MIKLTPLNSLKIVFIILIVSFTLYLPKIYLRNNIYYTSKSINKLYVNYISLIEENRFLSQQLEDKKFKNQIIDSLLFNPMEQE